MSLLAKAADAIELILDDPIGFLGNLIGAIKQGVNQFVGNIWTHLKAGFMKWLFGSLADAGIEIPTDLSLVSLFKMVMSVLGLTIPRLKAKAIKLLGPTAVAVITKLVEYVSALITGGPAKLWEQVKADVGDLKAMIIDAIQDWLITTIITTGDDQTAFILQSGGRIYSGSNGDLQHGDVCYRKRLENYGFRRSRYQFGFVNRQRRDRHGGKGSKTHSPV